MKRNFPIITDSGGFQVFSLMYGGVASELKSCGTKKNNESVLKISEDGVLFRSYKNGSKILLTPESSVDAQKKIGADIIVAFDELPPYHAPKKHLLDAFERTHRWETRSLEEHKKNPNQQALYAVVHGGMDIDLRKKSIENLAMQDFDGLAIGGSVGKNSQEMLELLSKIMPAMPTERPNHLLGIGDVSSIKPSVELGIDSFDSSHPSKCARHGLLFTDNGNLRIMKSGNSKLLEPVERGCECFTCQHYTVAYLHHLFKAHELSYFTLSTIHNIHFMTNMMRKIREKILEDLI